MASIDDELCLCDWNDWPCAERNKKRLLRYLKADFTEETSEVLENAKMQLKEYFVGVRKTFDVKIHPVMARSFLMSSIEIAIVIYYLLIVSYLIYA